MIIYRDGKEIHEIKDFKVVGKFMEVATLDCTIKSATPILFEIGDYVVYDYNGLTYSLYDVPTPKKQARSGTYGEAFIYDLKFKSDMEQLSICPFLDLVANDNGAHYTTLPSFSTFEDVYGIAARIQANMDYLYPNKWRIEVANTTDAELRENLAEAKEYSISGQSCLEGLKKIYDTWGVGFIHSVENGLNVISIGKSAGTTSLFCYGKGQGLRTVKKSLQNTDQFATRVYAYGSTRNIPARWYNDKGYIGEAQYAPHLMIPPSKWVDGKPQGAYIDAVFGGENRVEKYGLRIKTFSYDGSNGRDEIFPSVEKVTAGDIRAAKQEIGESQYIPSSRYSDSARMDLVLIGSKVEDDGIKAEAGYELFSEKLTAEVKEVTKTEIIAEPIKGKPEKYVLQSPVNTIPICSFNIEKTANYRISEINDMAVFTKNDLESTVKATWYMQTPSGGYLDLRKSITFTDKLEDTLHLPLIDFTASEPGTYTLVLRLEVTWSVDYVVPQIDGDIALSYTIKGEQVEIARGERILDSFFDVYIKQIGFDLNTVTASDGSHRTISFKSGMCAGRSFVVTQCVYDKERDAWQLTCKRTQDGSVSQTFPNSIFQIANGDQFVLLNINMPDLYVYTAMQRLYNTALADLKHYSNPQFVVSPEIDNIQMARSPQILKEGMYMPIEDADISINDDILIDGVTITENGKELRKFDVTLRNDKIYNRFSRIATSISALEKSIEEAKKNSVNVPMAEIVTDEVTLDSTKESNKLFFFDEETGAVRTKYDLVVEKSITFGGAKEGGEGEGEGEGGGGSAGITTFDVFVGNNGPYPLKDGKVNLPAYPVVPTDYASVGWVEENFTPTDAHNTLSQRVTALENSGTGGGSGGTTSVVSYNPSVLSGKLLGTLTINGVDNKIYAPAIPTKLSAFTNDGGYVTESWVNGQGFLTEEQDISHLLSKTEAEKTYQPKGDYATIQALNAATTRISTLETTLSTEQGYIATLQGYFTSGKAKKAIADGNGNNIVDTYATKVALSSTDTNLASLSKEFSEFKELVNNLWYLDPDHADTVRTKLNVVVEQAISFGGYGESSGSGGGITTVTKQMVLDALGYTPYDSANPKGYVTSTTFNALADRVTKLENTNKPCALEDVIGIDENGDVYIKKNGSVARNFYTYGAISFGGYGESSGSGGGGLTAFNVVLNGTTYASDGATVTITEQLASKSSLNSLINRVSALENKTYKSPLEDIVKVDSNGDVYIDGNNNKGAYRNFYVKGAISFGGYGESSGSGSGGITTVTKQMVLDALEYTPYDAANPKGYITSSALSEYAKLTDIPSLSNYVTLTSNQNITGVKTFTNGLKVGSVGLSETTSGSTKFLDVDGSLSVSGHIKTNGQLRAYNYDGDYVLQGGLRIVTDSTGRAYIDFSSASESSSVRYKRLDIGNYTGGDIAIGRADNWGSTSTIVLMLDGSIIASASNDKTTRYLAAEQGGYFESAGMNFAITSKESSFSQMTGVTFDWLKGTDTLRLNKIYYSGGVARTALTLDVDGNIHASSKLIVGTTNIEEKFKNNTKYLEIDGNLVVTGAISFGGFGEGSSTGGGGLTSFKVKVGEQTYNSVGDTVSIPAYPTKVSLGLGNVTNLAASGYLTDLSSNATNAVSITVGGTTKNISASTLKTSLGLGSLAYKNSLSFSELASKPTTISGYGITDAYTKEIVDSTFLKLSGGNITGSLSVSGKVAIGNTTIDEDYDLKVGLRTYSRGFFAPIDGGYYLCDNSTNERFGVIQANNNKEIYICWSSTLKGYSTYVTGEVVKFGSSVTNTAGIGVYNNEKTVSLYYDTTVYANLVVTGSITFGSASDRRLKDNIKSMTDEQAVAVLSALNPVTFQWNTTANELGKLNGVSDGFVADEYEKLIPNSGRDIWANYRAIDHTRVSSYLVKGWQNHETRLEKAERRIKELENELKQYRRA